MDPQFKSALKSQVQQYSRPRFERDLRHKLQQKCPPTSDEKAFLQKTFKFFDIQNKGSVNQEQFVRSCEKLGVVFPDSDKIEMLFNYYDRSGDGRIDYKEFTGILVDGAKTGIEIQQEQEREAMKPVSKTNKTEDDTMHPEQLVALFREKLKARGARGIVGIQRLFKIIDDDGSHTLSLPEFTKACKDFKIGIGEDYMPTLFNYFDSNRDGCLNIDEFLMAVRGELNEKRLALIRQAFRKIDLDNSGKLEISDIRDVYRADKHPDVTSGKKTADQVLVEFLETFEAHHNMRNGSQADGSVTLDEFVEYYKNISVSIDSDDYFALIMNNSWNLKGDATPYLKYEKGWKNEDSAEKKPVEWLKPPQQVHRNGVESGDNPLNRHQKYYDTQGGKTTATRSSIQTQLYTGSKAIDQQTAQEVFKKEIQRTQQSTVAQSQDPVGSSLVINGPKQMSQTQSILLERFRTALASRGARGFIGMQRQFKIMDDNNSGSLDQYEFTKAIHDFGVKIDQKDIATLFRIFDIDGNNEIDFNEFVRTVVGPMNQFRTNICIKAFKTIDVNGDGVLQVDDIKKSYNAKFHPDVKAGKKTEDEVLKEFLETFESHYNVMHGTKSDRNVTPDEFLEYYANISANIDNDAYFELMMANAWNIDSRNNPNSMPFAGVSKKITAVNSREAYRNDHHRNLFGTDKATPFEKKEGAGWQTTSNSHFQDSGVDPNKIKAAGGLTSDPKMAWVKTSQRTSAADYTGIRKNENELAQMFRDKLAARGARGVLGMQRVFKVMDDNGSGTLDIQEFWKAICDFRIPVSAEECRKLFDMFDLNGDGEVDYNELMRCVVGEMNPMRKDIVKKAFKKLDKDASGIVELSDLQSVFNAKNHPDVKAGKKTEDEVLSEWLDTFELHHSLKNPDSRDRRITFEEFVEYYTNISSTIDNDEYFDLMITNAWNLNDKFYSKGWGTAI